MRTLLSLILTAILLVACGSTPVATPRPEPIAPAQTAASPSTTVAPTTTAPDAGDAATPTRVSNPPPTRQPTAAPSTNPNALPRLTPADPLIFRHISMVSPTAGWAFATTDPGSDHLLTTRDAGQTWAEVTPPVLLAQSATAHFADADRAWLLYTDPSTPPLDRFPSVLLTSDGGQNWVASAPLPGLDLFEYFDPSHLQMVDDLTGFLLVHLGVGMNHDYIALYGTQDGGGSWQILASADDPESTLPQSCQKTDLRFVDATTGYLAIDCGGVIQSASIARTTDGGLTWEQLELPPPTTQPAAYENGYCGATGLHAPTPDILYIVVSCFDYTTDETTATHFLYRTSDAAQTFTDVTLPAPRAAFLDAVTGFALDRTIYRTTNGGQSWSRASVVAWDGQFSLVNPTTAFAVATTPNGENALVRTTTSLRTWQLLRPTLAP